MLLFMISARGFPNKLFCSSLMALIVITKFFLNLIDINVRNICSSSVSKYGRASGITECHSRRKDPLLSGNPGSSSTILQCRRKESHQWCLMYDNTTGFSGSLRKCHLFIFNGNCFIHLYPLFPQSTDHLI